MLALAAVAGCGGAADQSADVPATFSPTFSAGAADPGSTNSNAARTAWLIKGGCRPVPNPPTEPTGATSFTTSATTSADVDRADPPALLTVTGRLAADRTSPVTLDLAQLDAMPQVECTVNDREAEGRDATFRGVLVADVLSGIGAQPQTTLHTAALNDYAVDLPVSDIDGLPVLLATRLDGQPMSVAHYGPFRVIYPTTGYNLDPTVYDPRRIWQLSTVDVA